jgi:hypothetical protein
MPLNVTRLWVCGAHGIYNVIIGTVCGLVGTAEKRLRKTATEHGKILAQGTIKYSIYFKYAEISFNFVTGNRSYSYLIVCDSYCDVREREGGGGLLRFH